MRRTRTIVMAGLVATTVAAASVAVPADAAPAVPKASFVVQGGKVVARADNLPRVPVDCIFTISDPRTDNPLGSNQGGVHIERTTKTGSIVLSAYPPLHPLPASYKVGLDCFWTIKSKSRNLTSHKTLFVTPLGSFGS